MAEIYRNLLSILQSEIIEITFASKAEFQVWHFLQFYWKYVEQETFKLTRKCTKYFFFEDYTLRYFYKLL